MGYLYRYIGISRYWYIYGMPYGISMVYRVAVIGNGMIISDISIYAPGPATPPSPPPTPMGWVLYTALYMRSSPSSPCGVVGVWYGMLGMYGVYGLVSMVCLVCMVGMLCMA